MKHFILLGGQRSGSSFFAEYLDNHPKVRCYSELFLQKWKDDVTGEMQAGRLPKYCEGRPLSRNLLKIYTGVNPSHRTFRKMVGMMGMNRVVDDFLNYYVSGNRPALLESRSEAEVLGFKMIYQQVDRFPSVLEWLKKHDGKMLHLVRENLLRMVISDLRAKQTGLHHTDEKVEFEKFEVPVEQLMTRLDRIRDLRVRHRKLMEGVDYSEITYEELTAQPQAVLERVFSELGVDVADVAPPKTRQLNPRSLEDSLSNFDEVAGAVKGTDYEDFLGS